MNSYRHGALTVIESASSQSDVLARLKRIDPRLFLERQVTLENQAVWCVVFDAGTDNPPITILEWRDSNDHPIHELSSGIVDRVQQMERQSEGLSRRVLKANEDRIMASRRSAQQHWAEIGTDFERLMSPGHSALLPRSQSLRMSRDKKRSQGWRI